MALTALAYHELHSSQGDWHKVVDLYKWDLRTGACQCVIYICLRHAWVLHGPEGCAVVSLKNIHRV